MSAPGGWLDRERLTVYPRIIVALYVVLGGGWLLSGPGLFDRGGTPIGADFVTFYAVSVLARAGDLARAWDPVAITAAERAILGPQVESYAFHYPPTFALLLLPLSLLPYLPALFAWWAASAATLVAVVRRIAPHPTTTGLALAFPGFFQTIFQGQNGALTTGILGAGLLLVDARPALGGAVLALITYKPHFAPLVAVALLAGRRWRALAAFVATSLAFAASSVLVFGPEPWAAFRANVPFALHVLEAGSLPWSRMPTVQVAAMLLGAPLEVARAAQLASTGVAVALVAWAWGRDLPLATRAVTLSCAALLASPFAFDYDLTLLAVPVAFLAREGLRTGWRPGEPALLALAWSAPLLAPAIAAWTRVSLGPLLLLALVAVALRRGHAPRQG